MLNPSASHALTRQVSTSICHVPSLSKFESLDEPSSGKDLGKFSYSNKEGETSDAPKEDGTMGLQHAPWCKWKDTGDISYRLHLSLRMPVNRHKVMVKGLFMFIREIWNTALIGLFAWVVCENYNIVRKGKTSTSWHQAWNRAGCTTERSKTAMETRWPHQFKHEVARSNVPHSVG
jgi:hypothetical protein